MVNQTMVRFGYPDTLVKEWGQWVALVRPAQVTLGSLVLAAKADATAFADLPDEAYEQLAGTVRAIEKALAAFCDYERVNYLMLMMVDPNVHFHIFPRYSRPREWNGTSFPDEGWPGPPQLKPAVELDQDRIAAMRDELRLLF